MSLLSPPIPPNLRPPLGHHPSSSYLSPSSSPHPSTSQHPPAKPTEVPRVTIPHLSYPHLISSILSHSDAGTLLTFRATSSYFRTWIDGALARHLVFGRRGLAASMRRGGMSVTCSGEEGRTVGVPFFHCATEPNEGRGEVIKIRARPSPTAVGRSEVRPTSRRRSSARLPDFTIIAPSIMAPVTAKEEDWSWPDQCRTERAGRNATGAERCRKRQKVTDPLSYARTTLHLAKIVDLVGGVPSSSLQSYLSSLSAVHTVRLRSDPRQYPYSEIPATRRIVFSPAIGCSSGGLFAPVVLIEDCLRGTINQVVTICYDPRHPHLPRMQIQPFALGPKLRSLTVIFRATRAAVEGTVYKEVAVPGLFGQLVGPALKCMEQGVRMRVVGLEDMPGAVFGLRDQAEQQAEELAEGRGEERGEERQEGKAEGKADERMEVFKGAIAQAWAGTHRRDLSWEEGVKIGLEMAENVEITTAEEYRSRIGEYEWAVEAEEESRLLAPRF